MEQKTLPKNSYKTDKKDKIKTILSKFLGALQHIDDVTLSLFVKLFF